MNPDIIVPVIVALIAFVSGVLAYQNTKKQVTADSQASLITNALNIVNEYQDIAKTAQERLTVLERDFYDYKAETKKELELQEAAIEELNAKNLKFQLILVIYLHQMKVQGITPIVDPDNWDDLTISDLRLTAESLSNIERRREGAR